MKVNIEMTFEHKKHWLFAFNKQCFKDCVFLVHLADPRVWVKIKLDVTYQDLNFIHPLNIENIQWLDGRPNKTLQNKTLEEGMMFLNNELEHNNEIQFDNLKLEDLIEEF